MDSQGFYASPRTKYRNGATNSGDAFGAMGQGTMQQVQKTNTGAAFDARMGHNMMQQSQTTNAAQLDSSRPYRVLQLQENQLQQRSNALPEKWGGSPAKAAFEEQACKMRVTEYMLWLRNRRGNNSIAFWREFVGEFYAPDAKKRLCVSMYDAPKIAGVFTQESWHCELCHRKPGHGLDASAEFLPRLFKIKFESGALGEFMYIDMPRGYHNSSGNIILEYEKAIQESIFDQFCVVREGQLRVVFSSELKICSWEFCARSYEELVPRRLLVQQIGALGSAAQMYRAAYSTVASSFSLANSAAQLGDTFKTPIVNELGYSRRYIRFIQISEVVNSMKDLIDQFWVEGTGPIESLSKYSRRATKRPLSEEPLKKNPKKKKALDFPLEPLQLMRNSIINTFSASSASNSTNTAQFIGHQGTTPVRSGGPRNSTNIPSFITYGPSTPSSSIPLLGNMSTANSTADVMPFGNSSGGAMHFDSFGTDTIFIDDDLLPSGSNNYAPSGLFQNDPWESNPTSVLGGVGSSKGKATFQGEASSSTIGPNLIPMDGGVEMFSIEDFDCFNDL